MIKLQNKTSSLHLLPYRGGAVSNWKIKQKDILYLDPTTYHSSSIKFQGGIPVMFPIFSTLNLDGSDKLIYDGKKIKLAQHGLARLQSNWKANHNTENEVSLYLMSSEDTLSIFPFPFELEIQYRLGEQHLDIEQTVTNPGTSHLPFIAGFHPFFKVSHPKNCEISGIPYGTPYYLQLNSGERDFHAKYQSSLNLGHEEINHHFRGNFQQLRLRDRLNATDILITSSGYPCTTVWSEPHRNFVCIEPNTGRRGAFETRKDLIRLAPKTSWKGKMRFKVNS